MHIISLTFQQYDQAQENTLDIIIASSKVLFILSTKLMLGEHALDSNYKNTNKG